MRSIVLLLLVGVYLASCKDICCNEPNSYSVSVGNKHYFIEKNFKTNFFGAYEYCRSIGMQLATLNSAEEHVALSTYIIEIGLLKMEFWLSGNDLVVNNTYNWMSTGEPIIYTNFGKGEPSHIANDGSLEHCIELVWDYTDHSSLWWNDQLCDEDLYFVCEMPQCI